MPNNMSISLWLSVMRPQCLAIIYPIVIKSWLTEKTSRISNNPK